MVHEVGAVLEVGRVGPLHVHEVGDVPVLDVVSLVLEVLQVLSQPSLKIWGDEQVILLVGRSVQEECRVALSVHVLVVHEHDLAIPVGMGDRQDVDAVHLLQELAHVRAGKG